MLSGHVLKRHKTSYKLVIELGYDPVTGKRRRIVRGFKGTRREAEARLRDLLAELERGTSIEPAEVTLEQYLSKWLADAAQGRLKPTTVANYRTLLRCHVYPALGHVALAGLQPLHLQELYGRLLASGRTDGGGGLRPRTVMVIHSIVHSALKQAVRWQLVNRNVADAVEPPKSQRPTFRVLDAGEIRGLLEFAREANHRDLPIIVAALFTGLRRGELLGLHWQDVDLDKGLVRVRQALNKLPHATGFDEPKTARARRTVTLPALVVETLRAVAAQQEEQQQHRGQHYQDHALVFTNPDGSRIHPDSLSHRFQELAEAAGFKGVRFHDLRHSHATLLLAEGIHPRVTQERLGHESIRTTMDTYSHVLPGMQQAVAAQLDALASRVGTNPAPQPEEGRVIELSKRRSGAR